VKRTVTIFILAASFLLVGNGRQGYAGNAPEQKKAFLMSLAIPGLGQYYAGSPGYAKLFFATEIAIWGMYYYNTNMKSSPRNSISILPLFMPVSTPAVKAKHISMPWADSIHPSITTTGN
jgi:hypothetical protein